LRLPQLDIKLALVRFGNEALPTKLPTKLPMELFNYKYLHRKLLLNEIVGNLGFHANCQKTIYFLNVTLSDYPTLPYFTLTVTNMRCSHTVLLHASPCRCYRFTTVRFCPSVSLPFFPRPSLALIQSMAVTPLEYRTAWAYVDRNLCTQKR